MSGYRLLKHRQYERTAEHLPDSIRRKAEWAQVLLGTRGRTPNVKTTSGYNARWRRTPVQGYHYYLWWIPLSESQLAGSLSNGAGQTILVYSIRHHDETDDPIDLASIEDFEEIALTALDPRFDEQRAVSHHIDSSHAALATVKGLPGSGKTISLFYLVRDLALQSNLQNLLYVTYTTRLKRAARDFLAAQAPEMEGRIHIRTLTELEKEITGLPTYVDPLGELADFQRYLDRQPASTLGAWRRYPASLYTEVRAHILGRTFPAGYPLPQSRLAEAVFSEGAFDAGAYAATRRLTADEAGTAIRLAERLRDDRFFLDQTAASRALTLVGQRKLPAWLRAVDGLIVDEVQDLTLLQIALLAELARARAKERNGRMALIVAGDESQIVQPSGFDWGVTKDLLREVLHVNPSEFEFRHQRRSPRNLAYLIDNSWNFYVTLPKALRPSANRQSFLDEADMELAVSTHRPDATEENGRLLICPLPEHLQAGGDAAAAHWRSFAEELAELPGRALVDLTGKLSAPAPDGEENKAGEVMFTAREIKGLERNTVLILGLNETYRQAMRLADLTSDSPPLFEARRLMDEMRVAISRSTDKLVLFEAPDAAVLEALNINHIAGHYTTTWGALRDLLRTEQMSEIEVVEGYLDEVDDLVERGRWEQAKRRNRRAYEFAVQIEDRSLQREAQAQFVQIHLQEADESLERGELMQALALNHEARGLAEALGDPAVLDEVEEQAALLRAAVESEVMQIVQGIDAGSEDPAEIFRKIDKLRLLVEAVDDAQLQGLVDEAAVATGWQWGIRLLKGGPEAGAQLAKLFDELARTMERQKDKVGARLSGVIAQRYRTVPHALSLSAGQLEKLFGAIDDYLRIVAALKLETDAYAFVAHWIEESFAQLEERSALYYAWAVLAERFNGQAGYVAMDDRLWDLENRVELHAGPEWTTEVGDEAVLRFGAFIAAYNGDAHDASLAWEKLGETELAIAQAREAGELERAYNLLRRAGLPIPEELSTAVKLARQAAQMAAKQQGLRRAERRALAGQLADLLSKLDSSSTVDPSEDADDEAFLAE